MILVSKRHPLASKPTAGFAELEKDYSSEIEDADLPNGLYLRDSRYYADCRSCDNRYEADWLDASNLKDWDPDYSYCGGSDRCIP